MKREMVEVRLYEDGTYVVEDVNPNYSTSRFIGSKGGKSYDCYICLKSRWKTYLLRLVNPKQFDAEIRELQRKKKQMEKLRAKILKEITNETDN